MTRNDTTLHLMTLQFAQGRLRTGLLLTLRALNDV